MAEADQHLNDFLSLQKAFERLHPTPSAHSHPLSTPLHQCFLWNSVFSDPSFLPKHHLTLYGVAFRSVRKSHTVQDESLLYAADADAFKEALQSRKLIKYWYGSLNERRECLASCIWVSREAAKAVMGAPLHNKAASLVSHFYETYTLEKFWIHCSTTGSFDIELISSTSSS